MEFIPDTLLHTQKKRLFACCWRETWEKKIGILVIKLLLVKWFKIKCLLSDKPGNSTIIFSNFYKIIYNFLQQINKNDLCLGYFWICTDNFSNSSEWIQFANEWVSSDVFIPVKSGFNYTVRLTPNSPSFHLANLDWDPSRLSPLYLSFPSSPLSASHQPLCKKKP